VRVAIDGLHLFGTYGGVQRALVELLAALHRVFPQDETVLYVPRDFRRESLGFDSDRLSLHRTWFPGRWRAVRALWRNFRLQAWAYRDRCELLHGATYALPSLLSLPSVLTLHDVIALSHPQFCTPGSAKVQGKIIQRSAAAARRILVPTAAARDEVLRFLKVDAGRVEVVPWGVGRQFRVEEDLGRLREARKQWRLPEQFVLYVGTLEPKKNLEGLLRGFVAAKLNRRLPHSLVFAGRMGWRMQNLAKDIREHDARDYVFLTGYVPDQALHLLYNLADLCVLNSHVEGVGLPVLEAMACGCPVVISSVPALREVAGDAAYRLEDNPQKPYQPLREAFESLLDDAGGEKLRRELRKKGLARTPLFTWEKTAQLTRAAYQRALEEK
jgi:glycosyltransferase involved in cell wall biosynthesis